MGPVKNRLLFLARLAIASALLFWLLRSGRLDFHGLNEIGARWPWLIAAQLAFAGELLVASARWLLLLRAQGIDYGLCDTGSLTLIGWFFSQIIVGTTGGDVVKAYAVAVEHPDRRSAAVVSIFVDRFLGLLVLFVVALAGAAINWRLILPHPELISFALVICGCLTAALGGILLFFSKRLRSRATQWGLHRNSLGDLLRRLDEAARAYRFHLREIRLAALASVLIQGLTIVTNLCLASALLSEPYNWPSFLVLVPLAHVTMALPINPPGAIGTGEATYAYLFGLIGISQGSLICILQRLTFYLWAIPGALLYVTRKRRGSVPELDWHRMRRESRPSM